MKKYLIVLVSLFLSGCLSLPKFNTPKVDTTTSAAVVVKAEDTKKQVDAAAEANTKVEAARKEMELQYAKFRDGLQKAYDDREKLDDANFAKIGELNYGIYIVTQEKKKQDINTLIAHLRSKEIMNRTDKTTPEQKTAIAKEVDDEKTKTIDQLYLKYNAQVELAISQKSQLDNAEALIAQKEKEKQQLREAQQVTINKIQAEKDAEIARLKKEANDQLAIAKANQKAEMVGLIVKALLGVGILFLVLAVLLKNITMGIGCIASLGLAYTAATIPMWVVGTILGGVIVIFVLVEIFKEKKINTTNPTVIQVQTISPQQPTQPPSS